MQPANLSDRLQAIQALASLYCTTKVLCVEQHAGVVARLLDAENSDTIENVLSEFTMVSAVQSLAYDCDHAENDLNPSDYGASQDCDTGVWDNTFNLDAACEDAREKAADLFLQFVRAGLTKDIYALTPEYAKALEARISAYNATVGE